MNPERQRIKKTAIEMVGEVGLINLSREELCNRAKIPDGSFSHVMGGTFANFVNELREEGVEDPAFPVSKSRTQPKLRKEQIVAAALLIARQTGYQRITRREVAEAAGCSEALVTRCAGTMTQLQRDIMRKAIREGVPEVVAQGLAVGDPHARKAPQELKDAAAQFIGRA